MKSVLYLGLVSILSSSCSSLHLGDRKISSVSHPTLINITIDNFASPITYKQKIQKVLEIENMLKNDQQAHIKENELILKKIRKNINNNSNPDYSDYLNKQVDLAFANFKDSFEKNIQTELQPNNVEVVINTIESIHKKYESLFSDARDHSDQLIAIEKLIASELSEMCSSNNNELYESCIQVASHLDNSYATYHSNIRSVSDYKKSLMRFTDFKINLDDTIVEYNPNYDYIDKEYYRNIYAAIPISSLEDISNFKKLDELYNNGNRLEITFKETSSKSLSYKIEEKNNQKKVTIYIIKDFSFIRLVTGWEASKQFMINKNILEILNDNSKDAGKLNKY